MSIDLAVWEGPPPASDAAAVATFDDLRDRFLETRRTPPTEAITDYVVTLLSRYPDLPDEDHETSVDVPWGSALLNNASGPIVYIDMKLNNAFHEGWRYCVELASGKGLIAFDPQSGAMAEIRSDCHTCAVGTGRQPQGNRHHSQVVPLVVTPLVPVAHPDAARFPPAAVLLAPREEEALECASVPTPARSSSGVDPAHESCDRVPAPHPGTNLTMSVRSLLLDLGTPRGETAQTLRQPNAQKLPAAVRGILGP